MTKTKQRISAIAIILVLVLCGWLAWISFWKFIGAFFGVTIVAWSLGALIEQNEKNKTTKRNYKEGDSA